MDDSIKKTLGITDPHIELDDHHPEHVDEILTKRGPGIRWYLKLTYPMTCPTFHEQMKCNGWRDVDH